MRLGTRRIDTAGFEVQIEGGTSKQVGTYSATDKCSKPTYFMLHWLKLHAANSPMNCYTDTKYQIITTLTKKALTVVSI